VTSPRTRAARRISEHIVPNQTFTPDLLELSHFSQSAADWSSSPLSRDSLLELAGVSLPDSAFVLLRYLEHFSALTVSGLAKVVGVHPSTVSTQLRPLLEEELVLAVTDSADRRVVRLSITAAGRRVCEEVREQGARQWAAVLSDWPAEDLHQLADLLSRVRVAVLNRLEAAQGHPPFV
jgi:DNA-binding MarR family transcriptional regulator